MREIKNKSIKWWIGIISIFILFGTIISFAYLKMNFLMKGVEIIAEVKQNDNSSLAEIKGQAKNAIYISLNGREIFIDKNGYFHELVTLLPGTGVITIDARDKFKNTAEKVIKLYYKI